jgi:hypothetical protein
METTNELFEYLTGRVLERDPLRFEARPPIRRAERPVYLSSRVIGLLDGHHQVQLGPIRQVRDVRHPVRAIMAECLKLILVRRHDQIPTLSM